jgi:aryl-alcohol dehydrogenase-like predicted oxidoreductase
MGGLPLPEASRLIDICLDAGVNLFDTADIYAEGEAEEFLGRILRGRRNRALIATKAFGRTGPGPDEVGNSRLHLIRACEASLRRLGTDWIDLYQLHGFDALIPLEETVRALDDLVRAGKVRYVGCSNFAAWQLMKALAIADRTAAHRFASQQIYYSLAGRDAEQDLIPLSLDQNVGVLVWGPLASGLLSGKFRRGDAFAEDTRMAVPGTQSLFELEKAFDIVDVARQIAAARGVSVAQVALNWLLAKPGVTSVILGARTEQQLLDNLGAARWRLSRAEVAALNDVSAVRLPYPFWHQRSIYQCERNPIPPSVRDDWLE